MEQEHEGTAVGICIYEQYTAYILVNNKRQAKFTRVLINPSGHISAQDIDWQISCVLADLRKEGYQPKVLGVSVSAKLLQECRERNVVYARQSRLYFRVQERLACTSLAVERSESILFAHDDVALVNLKVDNTREEAGIQLRCIYCKDMKVEDLGSDRYENIEKAAQFLWQHISKTKFKKILVDEESLSLLEPYFAHDGMLLYTIPSADLQNTMAYGAARYALGIEETQTEA